MSPRGEEIVETLDISQNVCSPNIFIFFFKFFCEGVAQNKKLSFLKPQPDAAARQEANKLRLDVSDPQGAFLFCCGDVRM